VKEFGILLLSQMQSIPLMLSTKTCKPRVMPGILDGKPKVTPRMGGESRAIVEEVMDFRIARNMELDSDGDGPE
jgi:hypothetical protein